MRSLALLPILCWLLALCAWVTHVVSCLKAGAIALLLIGAIIFPIGVIHGWLIWLGIM
ncbi:hypothetical protein [Bradyrhizobium ottawaense]|uniref:Uncharacterized protein n=1 Tax=Bradyrhizobium ottawaense TaxID=931866 RepID=A0ABY0QHC9_9BRAD|nr:hypothetical protein [Bradyrhizobium ottawaense]SDK41703.1 hypothetical protein SAMN05444163_8061 [Bradyrhizobium ottawaense]